MTDKFVVSTNTVGEIIVTDTETGKVYRRDNISHFFGLIRVMNEQQTTIITLKRRLEKINGGYGLLTHRNGLTANEWLIESQERELEKKNEEISDWIERHSKDIAKICEQQATVQSLKEENEQLKKRLEHYKEVEAMNGDGKNE